MRFLPVDNYDHVVSVSTDFPAKRDALFHSIAYGYYHADWGSLRDNLRNVPGRILLISVLLLLLVNFGNECKLRLMYILITVKYQVKPLSHLWFLPACAATIVHRNLFFFCINRINLVNLK